MRATSRIQTRRSYSESETASLALAGAQFHAFNFLRYTGMLIRAFPHSDSAWAHGDTLWQNAAWYCAMLALNRLTSAMATCPQYVRKADLVRLLTALRQYLRQLRRCKRPDALRRLPVTAHAAAWVIYAQLARMPADVFQCRRFDPDPLLVENLPIVGLPGDILEADTTLGCRLLADHLVQK